MSEGAVATLLSHKEGEDDEPVFSFVLFSNFGKYITVHCVKQ